MQQIRKTVRSVSEWRSFLRTFAGPTFVSKLGTDETIRIRRQHAMAAVVLEFAISKQMPSIDVSDDRVVIQVAQPANFTPARQ